jgi:hypothetical protein
MKPDGNSSVALAWGPLLSRPGMARRQKIHAAEDSKHGRDRLFLTPRQGGGGTRDPCKAEGQRDQTSA